jgi:mono/diheme cytochrome c family protein
MLNLEKLASYAACSLVVVLVLSGCEQQQGHMVETMSGAAIERQHDLVKVAAGEQVYRQHCASCHGDHGQGAPQWRQAGADGKYPPPPLDGSGHAWHHPRQWLQDMIHEGSPNGQGNMPAWKDKLSDQEIDAVVEWFQSTWPDDVYAVWFEMQQNTRR